MFLDRADLQKKLRTKLESHTSENVQIRIQFKKLLGKTSNKLRKNVGIHIR